MQVAIPCPVSNERVNTLHDLTHGMPELPAYIARQDAAEDIGAVLRWTANEAHGLDREHLTEAFRTMIVEASDKRLQALIVAIMDPARYPAILADQTDWVRGYARRIAAGEVRA